MQNRIVLVLSREATVLVIVIENGPTMADKIPHRHEPAARRRQRFNKADCPITSTSTALLSTSTKNVNDTTPRQQERPMLVFLPL